MSRTLTVTTLMESGFEEVECWSATESRLNRPTRLPDKRGVYAFAIGGLVVYVGLASRSIKQRLGFYATPGPSQRTNIRLNAMITELVRQGQVVRILLAHPEDGEWNGLRLSGPEGLEAALIEDFDLPWNVRGSGSPNDAPSAKYEGSPSGQRAHGSTPRAILDFVAANPRCTELEIARAVFGPGAVQPQANQHCRKLVADGLLVRRPTRPFTYVRK